MTRKGGKSVDQTSFGTPGRRKRREHCAARLRLTGNSAVCYRLPRSTAHLECRLASFASLCSLGVIAGVGVSTLLYQATTPWWLARRSSSNGGNVELCREFSPSLGPDCELCCLLANQSARSSSFASGRHC